MPAIYVKGLPENVLDAGRVWLSVTALAATDGLGFQWQQHLTAALGGIGHTKVGMVPVDPDRKLERGAAGSG